MSLADVNEEQTLNATAADEDVLEEVEQAQADTVDEGAAEAEAEDEGVVVSIGDESPPSEDEDEQSPELVRKLRKLVKEAGQKQRDAEKRLQEATKPLPSVELGPKPTLESCGYDEEDFEQKLDVWKGKKAKLDDEQKVRDQESQAATAEWNSKLATYESAKRELKVADFDDAETVVKEALTPMQQTILVKYAKKSPELIVYALGKNPKELAKLASIKDPVEVAIAVRELESQLKVTPRKAAPLPESTVRGSAPVRSSDKNLERLEAEAEKSGDRTKVIAYRKAQRQKAS